MDKLNAICELLGTDRVEKLKDYILGVIECDIEDTVKNSYNYIISPETFEMLGEEVFDEVKEELKKKYKKQLKGVLEAKILKVIDECEGQMKEKKNEG